MGTRKRVLIVDDEVAHLTLIKRALRDVCDLSSASSSDQAMSSFERLAPALVILDLNLGAVSGLETLRLLRLQTTISSMPVIMLSTSALQDDVAQSYALGANCYMTKAEDPILFQSEIRRAVNFFLLRLLEILNYLRLRPSNLPRLEFQAWSLLRRAYLASRRPMSSGRP